MSIIRKKSLTRKMLIYMLLIGLLPLVTFGGLSIMSTDNVLKNETINFHKQFLKQKKQYIELVMSDIDSLAANLSGIEDIQNTLTKKLADTSYNRLTTQAKIGYILSGYSNLNGMVSIDIFSNYGVHFHVGETLNVNNINNSLKEQLLRNVSTSDEPLHWSGIERNINSNSKYQYVITAAKALRAKPNTGLKDKIVGLLIISYDPNVFSKDFSSSSDKSEFSLILDSKNRIIYHPDNELIGKNISESISSEFKKQEGYFEKIINEKRTLVIYSKILRGNWTVASFIPVNNIYSKSHDISVYIIFLMILSIAAIAIFGVMVSKQVVLPIRMVTDTFKSLQKGEMENPSRLMQLSNDEIGELGRLFNSFIDAREDITVQKKLERQLNEQNAELQKILAELKNTQTQMIQQEKLAGIGQLAAGVAHEINNPLGYVNSNFDTLSKYIIKYENILDGVVKLREIEAVKNEELFMEIEQSWNKNKIDKIRKDMTEIISDTQDGLDRIAIIVNGLKSFSRTNQYEEKSMFDLNDGIRTTLLVANNELKYSCKVSFEKCELPHVTANAGQINQVVLNLLINAVYAIKEKHSTSLGEIIIKTFLDSDNIYCSICDNGCGMPENVKNRIFEPFFTTKPVGKGTGLGLGIVYDIIVNKHGGKITVDSELGQGSCFTFALPIKAKDGEGEMR